MNYQEIFTTGPATFNELAKAVWSVYYNGSTFEDYKKAKEWCIANHEKIKQMANKLTIKELNGYAYKATKPRMVSEASSSILSALTAGEGISYCPTTESYSDALQRELDKVTEEKFFAYKEKLRIKREIRDKALNNPETLEEYKTFIMYKGESALSNEQKVIYDELMTGTIKKSKEREQERKATVTAVAIDGVDMLIQETVHTKKGHKLWVVKLSERVERFIFNDLNDRAKKLGGYYSSYRGNGAIPGFTFDKKEAAELFVQIKDGDVNAIELRKAINAEKQTARAETLEVKGETLKGNAEEDMNRDRKDNTARRARIATGIEQRAAADVEFAITMIEISKRMSDGTLQHLNRLANYSQLEELENVLYQCKWDYIRENNIKSDSFEFTPEVVNLAKFPYPVLYRETHLANLLRELSLDKGKLLAANRMMKRVKNIPEGSCIDIKEGQAMDDYEKLFTWSSLHLDEWTKRRYKGMFLRYKRITQLGITTIFELRTALRELIRIKEGVSLTPEQKKMQQIRELERKFIGLRIDGFFPTPEALGRKLVALADVQPSETICEPEAGLGHIAELIAEEHPDNELTCIEYYQPLHAALQLKGFNAINTDFLQYNERKFDVIIMNPPFENNADIDHVLHAWDLLNPKGRIVAVMAGNKSKSQQKVSDFMEFLLNHGHYNENPTGSFETAFRPTGVNTITVVLTK